VQGIGSSERPFNNYAYGFYLQDSWKIHPRLTLNYGVRYDYEHTPIFPPGSTLNADAEAALGLVEGLPRDTNNVAPRFALAWDPWGDGKTILRAGYGIFFDHPLLANAFLSATADGALSSQLIVAGGRPSNLPLNASPSAFNAASFFQGIFNPGLVPGIDYRPGEQRFGARTSPFFNDHGFITTGVPLAGLPFTLPVDSDFVHGYAQQANLTLERQLGSDWKFGASYTYVHGLHLNRPRNINAPDTALLTLNAGRALSASLILPGDDPRTVVIPSTNLMGAPLAPGTCLNTPQGSGSPTGSVLLNVPGFLGTAFSAPNCPMASALGLIGTAAAYNQFRPSGPNPSFGIPAIGGFTGLTGFATSLITSLTGQAPTFASVQVPWSDVVQQESTGESGYHGLTVTLSKRFSQHFELLSSWTWSHSIDDSTDLQSLLTPQDNRRADLERSSSTFDQRHRWVVSAVMQSPYRHTDEGIWKKIFADFTVAPIWEMASGRPYTVLTGADLNLDFGPNSDRPSIATTTSAFPVTSPFISGVTFAEPDQCDVAVPGVTTPFGFGCTGSLGRNSFDRPGFISMDLRVSRRFYFNEQWSLDVIADAFNLFNRFNVGDVSPLCNPVAQTCNAGQATAALDPRQFQFALKINW
jgi:hypothetical protein